MNFFGAKTDPKFTKSVSVKGKPDFTNIDAYYLLGVATEKMGPLGSKWGIKDHEYSDIHLEDGTIVRRLTGKFYHDEGEYPIAVMEKFYYKTSQGYMKVDTDIDKKLMTHFYSKALSYIGLGADVYKGQFEDPTYVAEAYQSTNVSPATEAEKEEIENLVKATSADMDKMLQWIGAASLSELTHEQATKLNAALLKKKATRDKEQK